jgi:hypothetical protein
MAWAEVSELCAVYADFGVSSGMAEEIAWFKLRGIPVENRVVAKDDMQAVMAIKNG